MKDKNMELYCCSFNFIEDLEESDPITVQSEDVSELKRRVETVIAGLRRGGIQAEILNRDGILALYDLINYRRIMPANYDSTKLLLREVGQ